MIRFQSPWIVSSQTNKAGLNFSQISRITRIFLSQKTQIFFRAFRAFREKTIRVIRAIRENPQTFPDAICYLPMPKTYTLYSARGYMPYTILDESTVARMTKNGNKRVICRINNKLDIHCAIITKKGEGSCIQISTAVCKKLGLKPGDSITASFKIDTSEFQFDMPEEFLEVLRTDPDAEKVFNTLTKGNQRGLIYLITQPKSIDKRIERALRIANSLKMGITSPKLF